MQPISNSTGSDSSSEKSSDFGFTESNTNTKQFYQELVARANTVSMKSIFKSYGLRLDDHIRSCVCPFPKHQDDSPSLHYYPATNSFWCFGCKTGTRPVDFVANMEDISRAKAAYKIIELSSSDSDFSEEAFNLVNYSERLEILIDFSNFFREFIQAHLLDSQSIVHIEKIAYIFDKMNAKYDLDNFALKALASKLKEKGNSYKACPQL